jgi:hypothetical protein
MRLFLLAVQRDSRGLRQSFSRRRTAHEGDAHCNHVGAGTLRMRSGYAADTRNPAASSTSPSYDGAAYARQVRDAVLEGLTTNEYQRPATFADMCQTTVSWACAIAKIESESPGSVKVTLARPRMSGCRVGMDPSAPRTRSVAASRSMSTTSLRLAE